MSRLESCKLVDSFTGRQIVRLTRIEAESMVRQGTAKRTGSHRYTLVKAVAPSDADESSAMLTVRDMNLVAAGRAPTVEEAERLQGWGFRVRFIKPRPEMALGLI